MKIRHVLLLGGLGVSLSLLAFNHNIPSVTGIPRKATEYKALTPESFTIAVSRQRTIRMYSKNEKEAELAGLIEFLAHQGYRLGYEEGLSDGVKMAQRVKGGSHAARD